MTTPQYADGERVDCRHCGKPIWRPIVNGVWVHTLTAKAACKPGVWSTTYAAGAES